MCELYLGYLQNISAIVKFYGVRICSDIMIDTFTKDGHFYFISFLLKKVKPSEA